MRLLLAEDEEALSRAICAILKKNCYETDAVYDGSAAYEFLMTGDYDGAILDIMMPGMNGIEVLKRVRAAGCRIPVIILSAKSDITDKVEGLDSGANDYLTKPFAPQELLARIRAMTRQNAEQQSSRVTFGNTVLDRSTYELSAPGGEYRLTGKEYQMMEMLMVNPHVVIPIERFMDRIWGLENDVEINVVWVYISYLRKKLTSIKSDLYIRVTRNVGYSLEEIK